ncbi:hypothetical protein V2J09_021909 [Rumex salicifolius]
MRICRQVALIYRLSRIECWLKAGKSRCFNLMMVAYTQQNVVLPLKKVGQKVNLEVYILGKYVEKLLSTGLQLSFV